MIEHITSDDIFNEVQLIRDASDVTIVLIEGDTDWRLFRQFIDQGRATIRVAHGKENATRAIQRLDVAGVKGVVAIVDADFEHLERSGPASENILLTDYHDVEIMLLCSGALLKLVDEYCSPPKVRAFLHALGCDDLLRALLGSARPMGLLRLINYRRRGNLDFDGVRAEWFLEKNTLQIVVSKMIRCVVNNTRNCAFTDSDISLWIDRLAKSDWDCKQLCCGHDTIQILGVGLRRALGSCSKAIADPSNVESVLRSSYDSADLRRSLLYRNARTWAKRNSPFKVFSV